jgi:hypothetical protein
VQENFTQKDNTKANITDMELCSGLQGVENSSLSVPGKKPEGAAFFLCTFFSKKSVFAAKIRFRRIFAQITFAQCFNCVNCAGEAEKSDSTPTRPTEETQKHTK